MHLVARGLVDRHQVPDLARVVAEHVPVVEADDHAVTLGLRVVPPDIGFRERQR